MRCSEAVRRVIDEQRHRVFTLAYYSLGAREDAEDVTQEVLIRFWKNADRVDPQRVEAWMVRTTMNACIDFIRKRNGRREAGSSEATDGVLNALASGEDEPVVAAESAEAAAMLRKEIARLDEPYRSLVILREVQGLSYREISDSLQMPSSQVRVYLHRGRRKLADRLAARRDAVSTAANDRATPR